MYLIWLANRQKEDPENQSIIVNFMSQYTNGYCLGTVDEIKSSEHLTRFTYYPRDLNYIRMSKQDKKIILKPQRLYALNKCIDYIPLGGLSSHRHLIFVYPPNIDEIPERIKRSLFGSALMSSIGELQEENRESVIYKKQIDSLINVMEEGKSDKAVRSAIEKLKETQRQIAESPTKKEEK